MRLNFTSNLRHFPSFRARETGSESTARGQWHGVRGFRGEVALALSAPGADACGHA